MIVVFVLLLMGWVCADAAGFDPDADRHSPQNKSAIKNPLFWLGFGFDAAAVFVFLVRIGLIT